MDGLAIVTGISLVVFLLLYLAFNIEKKHQLLQLLIIGYAVFVLALVPQTTSVLNRDCAINTSGAYLCYYSNGSLVNNYLTPYNMTQNIGITFVKSYSYFLYAFAIYIFVAFIYYVFMWFQNRAGSK
jgi:hypothetical protein